MSKEGKGTTPIEVGLVILLITALGGIAAYQYNKLLLPKTVSLATPTPSSPTTHSGSPAPSARSSSTPSPTSTPSPSSPLTVWKYGEFDLAKVQVGDTLAAHTHNVLTVTSIKAYDSTKPLSVSNVVVRLSGNVTIPTTITTSAGLSGTTFCADTFSEADKNDIPIITGSSMERKFCLTNSEATTEFDTPDANHSDIRWNTTLTINNFVITSYGKPSGQSNMTAELVSVSSKNRY